MSESDDTDEKLIEAMARAACEADGYDPDEKFTHRAETQPPGGTVWIDDWPRWRIYQKDACRHLAMHRALMGEMPNAYYAHELPQQWIDAIRKAEMDPKHDRLNELMDDPDEPQAPYVADGPKSLSETADELRAVKADWLENPVADILAESADPCTAAMSRNTLLESENATLREERDRLREALETIRGWREIDVSSDERHLPGQLSAVIERIEQICDAALTKGKQDD